MGPTPRLATLFTGALLCLIATGASTSASAATAPGTPVLLAPAATETLYTKTSYDFTFSVPGAASASVAASGATVSWQLEASRGLLFVEVAASQSSVSLTVKVTSAGGLTASQTFSRAFKVASGYYPRGDRYLMGLYGCLSSEFTTLAAEGYGMVQSYSNTTEGARTTWLQLCEAAGLRDMTMLQKTDTATNVSLLAQQPAIGWWALPEELRYWVSTDWSLFTSLSSIVRADDAQKRPLFMYIASSYTGDGIAHYVPTLDIIGAGNYPDYHGWPRSAARWRIESELYAIHKMGYTVATKTPISILGFFSTTPPCTAAGLYHDIFASLSAGAQAEVLYAYAYVTPNTAALADLNRATRLLTGPEALGEWALHGTRTADLPVTFLSGPTTAPSFTPPGSTTPIVYPSVRAAAWDHAGTRTIVAVNTASQAVTAEVGGLGTASAAVRVVDESRTLYTNAGVFRDTWEPLAVHVYKVRLVETQ
jgi:hypothetical protein